MQLFLNIISGECYGLSLIYFFLVIQQFGWSPDEYEEGERVSPCYIYWHMILVLLLVLLTSLSLLL